MTTLEPARIEEIDVCMEIIKEGKKFQEEQGFTQWTDDYPDTDTIRSDIENIKGYVLKMEGKIAGYMCIDFDGEPAYDDIQGKWRSEGPYAVIHRMAFRKEFRGRGLTDITFKLIEDLCIENDIHCIRVDTDFSNKRMQHIFKKNGFENCGEIIFQGSGKLAYDTAL